ncbi:ABC transporter permease [Clostridia bacterium]|nr:ABC transporter permease [Clostridia bacterium]
MRTFLTVLGVVIGTASIVVMVSLGIGMNNNFKNSMEQMGDLLVANIYLPWQDSNVKNPNPVTIDDTFMERVKKMDGVVAASPTMSTYLYFLSGKYTGSFNVTGVDPSVMAELGYTANEGRVLDAEDALGAKVLPIVFGYNAPFDFHPVNARSWDGGWWSPDMGEDTREMPIDLYDGKMLMSYDWSLGEKNPNNANKTEKKVKPYKLEVVGRLTYGSNSSWRVFMPLEEVAKIDVAKQKWQNSQYKQSGGTGNKRGTTGFSNAVIKFSDIKYVVPALTELRTEGYDGDALAESLQQMQEISRSMQMLLGAIGGVSLVVAAIGISNTMVMSIYERTREIGIMKVIGASIKDIRRLFLLEAALIGVLGGLMGVGVSYGVSAIINKVGISFLSDVTNRVSWGSDGGSGGTSEIPIWLCLFALLFSAAVGLISGYFPARRAMKLSALSAIRTE